MFDPPTETRWFIVGVVAVVGLLVGSFLNVCIFRLPRDCMSIVRPRSRCIKCLRFILWYENIPVFSWLALRGKCRGCRAPISMRYPLIELLSGGAFFYVAWASVARVPGALTWIDGVTAAIALWLIASLIVCSAIDLDFQILPDEITISGIVLGLALGAAFPEWHVQHETLTDAVADPNLAGLLSAATGAAVGAGTIWVIGTLGKLVLRKEAMGLGDVKLMGFLGAFIGPWGFVTALVLACFVGAVYGVGHLIVKKDSKIPFGPFLAVGSLSVILFWPQIHRFLDAYFGLFGIHRGTWTPADPPAYWILG